MTKAKIEERYQKIRSCSSCYYSEYQHDPKTTGIIHICKRKEHEILNKTIPSLQVPGGFYPITSITQSIQDSPIPIWCKLPK